MNCFHRVFRCDKGGSLAQRALTVHWVSLFKFCDGFVGTDHPKKPRLRGASNAAALRTSNKRRASVAQFWTTPCVCFEGLRLAKAGFFIGVDDEHLRAWSVDVDLRAAAGSLEHGSAFALAASQFSACYRTS